MAAPGTMFQKVYGEPSALALDEAFRAAHGPLQDDREDMSDQALVTPENANADDFKHDISRIAVGATQMRIAEFSANRSDQQQDEDSGNADGNGYGADDPLWAIGEQLRQVRENIQFIDQKIAENERQQQLLADRIKLDDQEIRQLDEQEKPIREEHDRLQEKVTAAEQAVVQSDAAQKAAFDSYDQKFKELYPNGKPEGEDDAIDTAEDKLHNAAWDRHRDEIAAEFESKGLGKEFTVLEKWHNHDGGDPADAQEAMKKAKAAGLSGDLDIALLHKLKQDDPSNPYLKTLDALRVGNRDALDTAADNREKLLQLYQNGTVDRLHETDRQLKEIDEKREKLMQDKSASKKELDDLQKERDDLIEQRKKLKELETKLKDKEIQKDIINRDGTSKTAGKTLDEIKQNWAAVSYVDNGMECMNPNSEAAQKAVRDGKAVAVTGDRTATSAADSGISSVASANQSFNNAASGNLPGAESAPPPAFKKQPALSIGTQP